MKEEDFILDYKGSRSLVTIKKLSLTSKEELDDANRLSTESFDRAAEIVSKSTSFLNAFNNLKKEGFKVWRG